LVGCAPVCLSRLANMEGNVSALFVDHKVEVREHRLVRKTE
jgi:hypothetical protein